MIGLTIVWSLGLSGQPSLVRISEVNFESPVEKQAIIDLIDGGDQFFEALSITEGVADTTVDRWKSEYYAFLNTYHTKERNRSNWIYLNKLFGKIHRKYLLHYNEGATMTETFSYGKYNCVSAVAIYAMAFDELGIDYVIKETPDHVYIVGLSRKGQMMFETTDPVTGFETFNYDVKKYFVAELINQKMVSPKEARGSVDSLFNKYYFKGKDINLRQLVGVQYMNMGLIHLENKEYRESFTDFEKAYLLYPSKRIGQLLFTSLSYQLQYADYSDWRDVVLLSRIPRYEDYDVNMPGIVGSFNQVNQYYHIDRADFERFEDAYHTVRSELPEPYRTELDYYYNFERARLLYNRGDYVNALSFTEEAFKHKPRNSEVEILMLNCFRQFIRAPEDRLVMAMGRLEQILDTYDHLEENKKFGGLILNYYLVRMLNAYHNAEADVGTDLHNRFTELAHLNPEYQFDPYIVGRAYSTAVDFYVKSGEISQANLFLDKGLDYAPFNAELINSKKLIFD